MQHCGVICNPSMIWFKPHYNMQQCSTVMLGVIIIIIIIIIIIKIKNIIVIILLTGANRDFLQSPHCAVNRLQHVHSSGPGAIVCKSCATHQALVTCSMSCFVPCGTKGQLSYTVWQSLNRIYLSSILLAEPLTDEGGEETRVPGENPWWRANTCMACDLFMTVMCNSATSSKWKQSSDAMIHNWVTHMCMTLHDTRMTESLYNDDTVPSCNTM